MGLWYHRAFGRVVVTAVVGVWWHSYNKVGCGGTAIIRVMVVVQSCHGVMMERLLSRWLSHRVIVKVNVEQGWCQDGSDMGPLSR